MGSCRIQLGDDLGMASGKFIELRDGVIPFPDDTLELFRSLREPGVSKFHCGSPLDHGILKAVSVRGQAVHLRLQGFHGSPGLLRQLCGVRELLPEPLQIGLRPGQIPFPGPERFLLRQADSFEGDPLPIQMEVGPPLDHAESGQGQDSQ